MAISRRGFTFFLGSSLLLPARMSLAAPMPAGHAALYEAAKKEGELTWYSAHYTSEQAERLGREFTQQYPGVKVNVVRTTAQVAYQRLSQDIQSNTPNCDVFGSTDVGHYVQLKERKLLMKYVPAAQASLDPRFQNIDPDGFFHTTSATPIALLYNIQKVKADQIPRKWTDLIDPKWRGQVAVGHPGSSGFVGTWAVQMRKLYGDEFFRKLEKNKPQVGRSIIDPVTNVVSGERMIAAAPSALGYLQASRGNPVGVSYPEEGAILMILPSAIMANAKHPNAAKLFMQYLQGPEAAQRAVEDFGLPLLANIKPREGVLPLAELKTIRPTIAEIVTGIPSVTEFWRDTFGV
ncbi:MAG: ABC transporter substrate-binding protein [Burkholderiaceae bacterium]